ncbi:MAG: efflux RND transporter periplasmic adaptor subunit [Gammaproteobacteria bacterium]|nr:efflux RND transporter periplasmic adaptor subunit [Gammaproteobacteria bacterium]
MLRTIIHWFLILAILAGAAFAGWHLSRPEPITVVLHTIATGKVEATVANTRAGTIRACRRSRLSPATGGQISELPVQEGDRVKAGQPLLAIWNHDLAARLKLALSEATASRARVDESCLIADKADREAKRQVRLRRQKLVSEEQVDQAVTEAKARRAACRAVTAAAEVSRARTEVAQAELERTILSAPFAGIVAEVNGELGEFITPSPPGIATLPAVDLIDDSCMYVSAPIDEVDAPSMKVGMPVCISLDALEDRMCNGRLRRIAPYVLDREKQARTVEVEVAFSSPAETENLLVGYSADVEIVLDTRENVLRIPTEAVLEGYRVLRYRETDGMLKETVIRPGLSNWRYTEILSGLSQGERVVTSIDREGVKAGVFTIPEE